MAASMIKCLGSRKIWRLFGYTDFSRTFLSDAYKCDNIWKSRLDAPYLQKLKAREFGIQMLSKCEQDRQLNILDVELFVNRLQDLTSEEEYIARDILLRYRHNNMSLVRNNCIQHTIVRGYLTLGFINSLLELLKDKARYGIFPDDQAFCMLLDHLIDNKDYPAAAQVAYEVMLQEDTEHPLKVILALYAAIQHFCHTMNFTKPVPVVPNENEEVKYVVTQIIRNPYYDDHFDIKDERFLLGKTLYYLAKAITNMNRQCTKSSGRVDEQSIGFVKLNNKPSDKLSDKPSQLIDEHFARSLMLIGLGLYEKFGLANNLLEEWSNSSSKFVVSAEALKKYSDFLISAPTRDPNAKPKKPADRSIDDEIELLKVTPDEKAMHIDKFNKLSKLLPERLSDMSLERGLDTYLWSDQMRNYEYADIELLKDRYTSWIQTRTEEIEKQVKEETKARKMTEIHEKLKAMQEREELLTYFENLDTLNYCEKIHQRKVQNLPDETKEEEVYVDAPGEKAAKTVKIKRK